MARALLILGTKSKIRILCARELQNSIAESVHKVLSDQIDKLQLSGFYSIEKAKIYGANGTEISFEGIKNNTNKIKSYEGIDYCWVEEAIKVSKASWKILIPTIRKEKCPNGHELPPLPMAEDGEELLDLDSSEAYKCGVCGELIEQSEIWMTFNPELDTDYTYKRFVLSPPPNSAVVKMTWKDNPWFPRVMYDEMMDDKKNDLDSYLNVWEGNCLQNLEGAVYAKELRRAQAEGRICTVPWDREWPVDTFWDLGRADNTAIWFAQRVAMQYRVLGYFEAAGQDITYFLKELQSKPYVYGTANLPHDAKAKRLGSNRTIEELVRHAGHRVNIVPKFSVTDGINAARIFFPNCWFDETECEQGLNALRHYRYKVLETSKSLGGERDAHLSNEPLHDWASDGADAFRYMAVAFRSPKTGTGLSLMEKLMRPKGNEENKAFARGGRKATGLGWLG